MKNNIHCLKYQSHQNIAIPLNKKSWWTSNQNKDIHFFQQFSPSQYLFTLGSQLYYLKQNKIRLQFRCQQTIQILACSMNRRVIVYDFYYMYILNISQDIEMQQQVQLKQHKLVDIQFVSEQNILMLTKTQILSMFYQNKQIRSISKHSLNGFYQNSKVIFNQSQNKIVIISFQIQEMDDKKICMTIVQEYTHNGYFKKIEIANKEKLFSKNLSNTSRISLNYHNDSLLQIKTKQSLNFLIKQNGQNKLIKIHFSNITKLHQYFYLTSGYIASKINEFIEICHVIYEKDKILIKTVDMIEFPSQLIDCEIIGIFMKKDGNLQLFLVNGREKVKELFVCRTQKVILEEKLSNLLNKSLNNSLLKDITVNNGINQSQFYMIAWKKSDRSIFAIKMYLMMTKNYKLIKKQIKEVIQKLTQNIHKCQSQVILKLHKLRLQSSISIFKLNPISNNLQYFIFEHFMLKKLKQFIQIYNNQKLNFTFYQKIYKCNIEAVLSQKIQTFAVDDFRKIIQSFKIIIICRYQKIMQQMFYKQKYLDEIVKYFYFILPSYKSRHQCYIQQFQRVANQQMEEQKQQTNKNIQQSILWKQFNRFQWVNTLTKQYLIQILLQLNPQLPHKHSLDLLDQFYKSVWCQQKLLIKHQYFNLTKQQIKEIHFKLKKEEAYYKFMDAVILRCEHIQDLQNVFQMLIEKDRIRKDQQFCQMILYYSRISFYSKIYKVYKNIPSLLSMQEKLFFDLISSLKIGLPFMNQFKQQSLCDYLSKNYQSLKCWSNLENKNQQLTTLINKSLLKTPIKNLIYLQQLYKYFKEEDLYLLNNYYELLNLFLGDYNIIQIRQGDQQILQKAIDKGIESDNQISVTIQDSQIPLDNPINLLPVFLYLNQKIWKFQNLTVIYIYFKSLIQYQLQELIFQIIKDGKIEGIAQNDINLILFDVIKDILRGVYQKAKKCLQVKEYILKCINLLENGPERRRQKARIKLGCTLESINFPISPIEIWNLTEITPLYIQLHQLEPQRISQIPFNKIHHYYLKLSAPQIKQNYKLDGYFINLGFLINYNQINKDAQLVDLFIQDKLEMHKHFILYMVIEKSKMLNKSIRKKLLKATIKAIKTGQYYQFYEILKNKQADIMSLLSCQLQNIQQNDLDFKLINEKVIKWNQQAIEQRWESGKLYIYEAIFTLLFYLPYQGLMISIYIPDLNLFVLENILKNGIKTKIFKFKEMCIFIFKLFFIRYFMKQLPFNDQCLKWIDSNIELITTQDSVMEIILMVRSIQNGDKQMKKRIFFYMEALLKNMKKQGPLMRLKQISSLNSIEMSMLMQKKSYQSQHNQSKHFSEQLRLENKLSILNKSHKSIFSNAKYKKQTEDSKEDKPQEMKKKMMYLVEMCKKESKIHQKLAQVEQEVNIANNQSILQYLNTQSQKKNKNQYIPSAQQLHCLNSESNFNQLYASQQQKIMKIDLQKINSNQEHKKSQQYKISQQQIKTKKNTKPQLKNQLVRSIIEYQYKPKINQSSSYEIDKCLNKYKFQNSNKSKNNQFQNEQLFSLNKDKLKNENVIQPIYILERYNKNQRKLNQSNEEILDRFELLRKKLNDLKVANLENQGFDDQIIQDIILGINVNQNVNKLIKYCNLNRNFKHLNLISYLHTLYIRMKSLQKFLQVYNQITDQIHIQEIEVRNIQILKCSIKIDSNIDIREIFPFQNLLVKNDKENNYQHYKNIFRRIKTRIKQMLNDSNVFLINKIVFFGLGYNKVFEHRINMYYVLKKIQQLFSKIFVLGEDQKKNIIHKIELYMRKLPLQKIIKKKQRIFSAMQIFKNYEEFNQVKNVYCNTLEYLKYSSDDPDLRNRIEDQIYLLRKN